LEEKVETLVYRDYGLRDPPRWLQKLALTSRTNGGRLVGIVWSRTQAKEFVFVFVFVFVLEEWNGDWNRLSCLRVGNDGWLFWARQWTLGYHKMLGNCWVTKGLAESQEILNSIELVS
jgi:hypothetical protein